MDWNDLRYALAIARQGGLAGAARELGVDHSSVYRRLGRLERELGVRLFERHRSGYRLTAAGERLADSAGRIETEAASAERDLMGADLRAAGTVRISTSEALALYLLPSMLADFRQQHAEIDLEIVVSNQPVDLTRRDADVAIRVTASPPEHLVGRRVGNAGYAAYAPRPVVRSLGQSPDLATIDWLGFDDTVARFPQAKWLARAVPAARVVMRFDSLCAMLRACELGSGAAVLPCFLGDAAADLARLPDTGADDEMAVYVLTHPDLRRSARVRACLQFFGDRIAAEKPRLLGRADRGRARPGRRD